MADDDDSTVSAVEKALLSCKSICSSNAEVMDNDFFMVLFAEIFVTSMLSALSFSPDGER